MQDDQEALAQIDAALVAGKFREANQLLLAFSQRHGYLLPTAPRPRRPVRFALPELRTRVRQAIKEQRRGDLIDCSAIRGVQQAANVLFGARVPDHIVGSVLGITRRHVTTVKARWNKARRHENALRELLRRI